MKIVPRCDAHRPAAAYPGWAIIMRVTYGMVPVTINRALPPRSGTPCLGPSCSPKHASEGLTLRLIALARIAAFGLERGRALCRALRPSRSEIIHLNGKLADRGACRRVGREKIAFLDFFDGFPPRRRPAGSGMRWRRRARAPRLEGCRKNKPRPRAGVHSSRLV